MKNKSTAGPATAGNLKKETKPMITIIGNVVSVGKEKDYTLKDGTIKKVRPVFINGAESQYRLYRSEKTEFIDGQNFTSVRWITSSKNPIVVKSMKTLPIKKAFNQDGKEYTYVPVEGSVKGLQVAAFPSQFNKPGEKQAVRVLITCYEDFQD